MFKLIGRLIAILGCCVIIYSLFIPAVIMKFEMPVDLELFKTTVNGQKELSLYNLGEELAEYQNLPEALNYLWMVFFGLALLNFLLAITPFAPKVIRFIFALAPLVLLGIVVYQTGASPDLGIGFKGLLEYLVNGFYTLFCGTLILFFGTLLSFK